MKYLMKYNEGLFDKIFKRKKEDAFKHTEQLFHMEEKKKLLEGHFKKQ